MAQRTVSMDEKLRRRRSRQYLAGTIAVWCALLIGNILILEYLGRLMRPLLVVLNIGLIRAAVSLHKMRRRYKIKPVDRHDYNKAQRPILYLRAFDSDRHVAFSSVSLTNTDEQVLARIFGTEFWAVARPDEELLTLGARRFHLSQDGWQDEIIAMMSKARMIIIRAGITKGLLWELTLALITDFREKMALFVPQVNISPRFHTGVEAALHSLLGRELPPGARGVHFISFDRDGGIFFDHRYKPLYRMRDEDRLHVAYVSLFRIIPDWNYLQFLRLSCHMNPAILYRAELRQHFLRRGFDIPPISRCWKDYAIFYPMALAHFVAIPFIILGILILLIDLLESPLG